jgi:hypothetical protein
MSANHPFKPPLENFRIHNFSKRNKMKKLIYVVDLKKNFQKCQKKQHFCNLSCEIWSAADLSSPVTVHQRQLATLQRPTAAQQVRDGLG